MLDLNPAHDLPIEELSIDPAYQPARTAPKHDALTASSMGGESKLTALAITVVAVLALWVIGDMIQ